MPARRALLRAMVFGLATALLLAACNHSWEEGYSRSQETHDGDGDGSGGY